MVSPGRPRVALANAMAGLKGSPFRLTLGSLSGGAESRDPSRAGEHTEAGAFSIRQNFVVTHHLCIVCPDDALVFLRCS